MDILPFTIGFFVVCGLIIAACIGVRARLTNTGVRDFLGISATFVVLTLVGFLMIIGEHALG